MSLVSPKPYTRHVFDASRLTKPGCPHCIANGMLRGGRILGENELFYIYVFEDEYGELKDCFIAVKIHHPSILSLPSNWGALFAEMYYLLIITYDLQSHNGYWNEGYPAGQRVLGHLHFKFDVAPAEGTPAYGKGLGLLRKEFNQPLVVLVLDRMGITDWYHEQRKRFMSSRPVMALRSWYKAA